MENEKVECIAKICENTKHKLMTWEEFSGEYCTRQVQTPEGLSLLLREQVLRFDCVGFMLLECAQMDSSFFAQYAVLPYGPRNTYKEMPNHPISPRGLASDMSVVAGYIEAKDVPVYAPTRKR